MATFFSQNHLLHASLLYLSIFFSLSKGTLAFEGRKIADNYQHELTHTIQVSNLLPSTTCKHSNKVVKNSATLKVVHKHGPCCKLNQDNANSQNLEDVLLLDQARVDSIHSRVSNTSAGGNFRKTKATKLPAKSGASLGSGNYIVTVGLGSPRKDLPLIFDTGSDLTWARCKPMVETFDPTKSTSYSNISCNSQLCSSVTSATGNRPRCASSTCEYGILYGDGSYTIGFLAKERLTIGSTDSFDNFYFGCGQKNEGLFGNVAGLLGLGKDKLSVVSQTASKYNKLFSYCIPTSSSTGFLSFGASESKSAKSAKFVPLSKPSSDFYRLDLTGISVGGKKLSIPSSVFSTSGTIIDSGTVITRLPPAAYSALRSEFQKQMSKYPTAPPRSILDTCYDFSKYETVNVPTIVLSFNGENDVAIDQTGIFLAAGIQQVCLAFAGNSDTRDLAIIGNTQQKTFEVIYDVNGGKIGFATGGCT